MTKLATILCLLAFVTYANPLQQWQWQHRIILINQADEGALSQIWRFHQDNQTEFADRRILFVAIQGSTIRCVPNPCIDLKKSALKLSDMPHKTMLLIGLDGGKKAAYPAHTSSFEEVFRDIDQMPMRRAQISETNN